MSAPVYLTAHACPRSLPRFTSGPIVRPPRRPRICQMASPFRWARGDRVLRAGLGPVYGRRPVDGQNSFFQGPTLSSPRRWCEMLLDRRTEREVLDGLLAGVRQGESRVLVVRGEPGVGKSALLEYVVEQASGCRVARAAGVQSEMELAFAGLQQVFAPILDRLERLPAPQRGALGTAF